LRKVWRFFSSMRLALILILILVGLSLIGTFVVQITPEYKADLESNIWWLQNVAQPATGPWFPLLDFLGLFDVFHSFWFLAAGSLLIINIIVCSLNRIKQTQAGISAGPIKRPEDFYKSDTGKQSAFSNLTTKLDAGHTLARIFQKRHYFVRTSENPDGLYISADKNRFSPLGTYIIHASLILFIAGFLIGSYSGFKDNSFIVAEGATREIGYDTGLSLKLNSFNDEYWPNGSPKDYRSNVVLYQGNEIVKTGIIQVNHPMEYKGIRVYQSFFGPSTQIQVKDISSGNILYEGNVTLSSNMDNHPYGVYRLDKQGYALVLVGEATNSSSGGEQVVLQVYKTNSNTPVASSILEKGTPFKAENIEVIFLGNHKYSGFQISKDPGNSIIWISSGLFVIGLLIVFYFPRKRIWAFVKSERGKEKRVWIRADSGRKLGTSGEIQDITNELRNTKP
jgi:cytochrome c biogenesis protein